jgi:hypothetical protein
MVVILVPTGSIDNMKVKIGSVFEALFAERVTCSILDHLVRGHVQVITQRDSAVRGTGAQLHLAVMPDESEH